MYYYSLECKLPHREFSKVITFGWICGQCAGVGSFLLIWIALSHPLRAQKLIAFQLPPMFTPGNCGRNVVPSPGIDNWDMAFQKNSRLGERFVLQTRFEFFNLWNPTQWQIFSGRSGGVTYGRPGFGSATFGRVTAARDSRVIQIAMKLIF